MILIFSPMMIVRIPQVFNALQHSQMRLCVLRKSEVWFFSREFVRYFLLNRAMSFGRTALTIIIMIVVKRFYPGTIVCTSGTEVLIRSHRV